jgi:hypothetical protein
MVKMKTIVLDRLPGKINQGPFWGNGKIGSVMYIEGNTLRFTLDHVCMWEMRDTGRQTPCATYNDFAYDPPLLLNNDPAYVTEGIWRTKLPGMTMKVSLPGTPSGFHAEMDLESAVTVFSVTLCDGAVITGRAYIDSLSDVIRAEFTGKGAESMRAELYGWDMSLKALGILRKWNYPSAIRGDLDSAKTLRQDYSGDKSIFVTLSERKTEESFKLLCTIGERETDGIRLLEEYAAEEDDCFSAHVKSWKKFWDTCGIRVPNERLQQAFDAEMYKMFSNERPDSAPVTLMGVWNTDTRMPAWTGDFHNDLNVQACYWAAFKTGNAELALPYIDHYYAAMPRFKQRAEMLTGVKDAIHVPTIMAPGGYGTTAEWGFWNMLLGPELYVATDFCWYFNYTRDENILREKIYPFITGVARLYRGIAREGEDGLYHIPLTSSPEVTVGWDMLLLPDSTFVISALHYILGKIKEYAALLDENAAEWEDFDRTLVPVKTTDKGYPLFQPDYDVFCSHRHFCHAFPIFPLSYDGHSQNANLTLDTIVNKGMAEFASWSFPYLAIFAARCARGNMARTMLELYCMGFRSANTFTVNGDPFCNGIFRVSDNNAGEDSNVFTLEAGLMLPAALCEMMVHRAGDCIYLLAGVPDEWAECSCDGVTVEGGHRIALEMNNYCFSRAVIRAGSTETVWVKPLKPDGEAHRIDLTAGETVEISAVLPRL